MCAPEAPAAPDYAGAAEATSYGNTQAALTSNIMAHPDIYTPLGSQTWTTSGQTWIPPIGDQPGFYIPNYDQNINLTPEGQELYDEQLALDLGLLDLGQGSLDQVTASLSQPMNFQSVEDIADSAYDLQTARLDPQWEQDQSAYENKLANQGLVPGSEAYDNAMRIFWEGRNDAYDQARLSSYGLMPQTYQLDIAQREQPLNELNAIRSGSQVQMPQFQSTQYYGTQGPDYLGAAGLEGNYGMGLYGSEMGSYNNMMSGLFGLGSMGMYKYPW